MTIRTFTLTSLVLAAVVAGVGSLGMPLSRLQRSTTQPFDKNSWPLTDYTTLRSTDAKSTKREIRGKKYDKSVFSVSPESPSENTTKVDSSDFNLPALPVAESNAIIVGEVMDADAYLSGDRSGVYSEFAVRIQETLKGERSGGIANDCVIDVEREGGRVKFPSGRVHWYSVDKENMPLVGRRYVFFVTRESSEHAYHILTAYELREQKVSPLDELPQFRMYGGKDESQFIRLIKELVGTT